LSTRSCDEGAVLFIFGYLLVALIFLAVGVCLTVSPRTYFGLLDRMARVDLWTKPGSSWDPKAPRWRALGAALTLFALLMVFGPPLSVYLRSPESWRERSEEHTSELQSLRQLVCCLLLV